MTEENLKFIENIPEQIRLAANLAKDIKVEEVKNIIISGIGSSIMAGDILESYLKSIPVYINKNFYLPQFTSKDSLVFVLSYSGNEEEAITGFRKALRAGSKTIVVTSGGKLNELAVKQKIPIITLPVHLDVKSTVALFFFSMLKVLENSSVIFDQSHEIEQLVKTLRGNIFKEKAKELAQKVKYRTPLIYAPSDFYPVAYRWKCQLNQKGIAAFCNKIPELNYNEVNISGNFFAIFLTADDTDFKVKERVKEAKDVIKAKGINITEIVFKGPSKLTKIFSAIYLGDLLSYYLRQ